MSEDGRGRLGGFRGTGGVRAAGGAWVPGVRRAALALGAVLALAGVLGLGTAVVRCAQGSGNGGEEQCGNGRVDDGEQCDGSDLAGASCESLGQGTGNLGCTSGCRFDLSGCSALSCGNGILEPGEECDSANLGGETCVSKGFDGGNLGCDGDCRYNINGCFLASCGNGQIDTNEECDDGNAVGGDGCSTVCRVEPGWSCTGVPSVCTNRCGNEEIDTGEDCDGSNLGSTTCETLGYTAGSLACTTDCHWDTSGCFGSPCGNGNLDSGEECDGANLGGATCQSEGFSGGTLLCASDCTFDTSGCTNEWCGDGDIDTGEECDGSDLNGATCASEGYVSGTLACTSSCTFDYSGCESCGNGTIQTGEECDGSNLDGATCQTEGYAGGTLTCNQNCTFNFSGCTTTAVCGNNILEVGEQCDDGNTAGGDGCSATCQWESTCSADGPIACGSTESGTLLFGGNNSAEYYDCAGSRDATGVDTIYSFTPANSGQASVFLDVVQDAPILGDNFDLYVLQGACNPVLCLAKGEATGDDTVNFNVTANTTYFLVVERQRLGFPPTGQFSVTLTCP